MAGQAVTIAGASYSDVPGITLNKTGGGTAYFADTSDANAVASDIASGKIAYVNGSKITGTSSGGGTTTLKMGVIRPDATILQSWSYDKWLIQDEVISSIPSYSTSNATLVASETLSPTVTMDYANYNYFVLERFLTIPTYNVSTKGKGRVEYHICSKQYEVAEVPGNSFTTLLDSTKQYTDKSVTVTENGTYHRLFYWSSGSAVAVYGSSTYGPVQAVVVPTITNGVMSLYSPTVNIRGHTSYFTSTYFNALTDIRVQYVIELWRVSKGSLNLNGWTHTMQANHIIGCVNTETHKLT